MHQNHLGFEVKAFSNENAKCLRGGRGFIYNFWCALEWKTQQTIHCFHYCLWSEAQFQEKKKALAKLAPVGLRRTIKDEMVCLPAHSGSLSFVTTTALRGLFLIP